MTAGYLACAQAEVLSTIQQRPRMLCIDSRSNRKHVANEPAMAMAMATKQMSMPEVHDVFEDNSFRPLRANFHQPIALMLRQSIGCLA